jgi:DNA polymerase sigma
MVQYFIHQHKHLKPILILLKKLLTKHQLNIPYHGNLAFPESLIILGGLNSYSLVLMCVSFFNSHPQYQILGENLIYFLKYYGSEYDFSEFAIFYDGQIM